MASLRLSSAYDLVSFGTDQLYCYTSKKFVTCRRSQPTPTVKTTFLVKPQRLSGVFCVVHTWNTLQVKGGRTGELLK